MVRRGAGLAKEAGLPQSVTQMFEIERIEKLDPKFLRIKGRIDAPDYRCDAGGVFTPLVFGIGGRQDDPAKIVRGVAEVKFRLFDRGGIAIFKVISEAERETVHCVQLRIYALGLLEQLDRRVGSPEPHQNITAAGQGAGIVRIYCYRASHFSLRLFIAMAGDVDTAENDASAHLRRVKSQSLCSGFLRAGEGFGR